MMPTNTPQPDHPHDAATTRRLARLRSMPVDTSRLESSLRQQIGLATTQPRPSRLYALLHSARAMAASVAVLFLLAAVLLYTATAPVSASAQTMAQLHEDLVAGRATAMRVDSIAAANRALASEWPESPTLPGVPEDHAMACCMKSIQNKRVACVLLNGEPAPVTMTVANASDMKSPADAPAVTRDGITYHTHAAGKLNMISTVRDGRYVCLIGQLPTDRLIDLASQLKF